MRKIKQRVKAFLLLTCLCVVIIIFSLINQENPVMYWVPIPLIFTLIGIGFSVSCILEIRKLKTAGLIIENQIMHIQSAKISPVNESEHRKRLDQDNVVEVFVSCFGILLDSKVIKFNQEGIRLTHITINRDHICLTYGTSSRIHETQILHERLEDSEFKEIAAKFQYETGIMPEIHDRE